MKTVILCGGLGSRLSEETDLIPKPLVEIGDRPMLVHVMEIFSRQGFRDFTLALGYKGQKIKEYFLNFHSINSNINIDFKSNKVAHYDSSTPDWNIDLVDTGLHTQTGGRLLRLREQLGEKTFMVTYGDGVANVDVASLLRFHRSHGRTATITAVRPPARFGELDLHEDGTVLNVQEKPQARQGWINGGFFVFEPGIFDLIEDDATILERAPLERLAATGQLIAYKHDGFWQCMDTLRDKRYLERLWHSGQLPWEHP